MNNWRYPQLRNGLGGHWHCGKQSMGGLWADDSGHGNHGVLTNMDPGTDWLPSENGYVLDFDGVNDYVSVPHKVILSPPKITVSVWFRLTGNPTNFDTLIAKSTSNAWNDGYGMYWGTNTRIHFWVGQFSANFAFSLNDSVPVASRTWHHAVGTYDGATVRAYVDGIEGTSDAFGTGYTASSAALEIGRGQGAAEAITAEIDDVSIFDRDLTATEISQIGLRRGILSERETIPYHLFGSAPSGGLLLQRRRLAA